MMVAYRRSRNMADRSRDLRRITSLPRAGGGRVVGALVLVALLGAGATAGSAAPTEYDQEAVLKFQGAKEGDTFKVEVAGTERPVRAGATQVRVRLSGIGGEVEIKVTVKHASGTECSLTIKLKTKGYFEFTLDLDDFICADSPDAGAPSGPEAGVDGPDVSPDASPDSSPDTAPPPSPECENYCTVMGDRCPSVYLTKPECLATCRAFDWPADPPGTFQNSIACRVASARMAPAPDDLLACYHAGPSGGDVCGRICRVFCEAAAMICPRALPGGSLASCLAAPCNIPTQPVLRAESGDTLDCRIHWLGVAAMDGKQSCARLEPGAQDFPCH
jgi:hypothetical protein